MADYALTINGQPLATEKTFAVKNPATGEIVGNAPAATMADLDKAVAAAKTAFETWSVTSDEERSKACMAVADVLEQNAEELAQILTAEQGKTLNGAGSRFEVGGAVAWTRYNASISLGVEVIQDDNEAKVEVYHKPLGVVGSIPPWNWPLMIGIWHMIPAIRAGNTVVIKPSPNTPLATLRAVELMNQVLPAGVLNIVTGQDIPGETSLGAAMSAHPDIAKISFTGSTKTGKAVMRSAAETVKRLTLELGGNDAGIVLPDADAKAMAEKMFWGAFINNGQTCAALKRLYVHDSIYDEVCDALVEYAKTVKMGVGTDEDNLLGPLQNRMQYDIVNRMVEEAKAQGGRVLIGGSPSGDPDKDGFFYPITLIADVDNGLSLVDEEQFGPVLPIVRYTDIDEVIDRANDNPNGLGGSIWSRDVQGARELAKRLECGTAWINDHSPIRPDAPFGGVKSSGFGTQFGKEGLAEFTSMQTVWS
ncbi:aldehyde dehydrogenase family protein [Cucumibacter marinus]|uniref:aldehyde dehydrogenase family protein n=1 Tax=Cucumibacter marinus TaxID=1121252 RepID=UPI000412EB1F|nr:aldehyde dehydrogenase family protein [Cucumibacter marinus]